MARSSSPPHLSTLPTLLTLLLTHLTRAHPLPSDPSDPTTITPPTSKKVERKPAPLIAIILPLVFLVAGFIGAIWYLSYRRKRKAAAENGSEINADISDLRNASGESFADLKAEMEAKVREAERERRRKAKAQAAQAKS
ncbi:hypothetical protein BJ508DRAFT_417041 [Ascobolus immersus RN42]|uniref:Uncharacterized protein n=1 Tax=Ascobolus immersus RN42 TaxID=1160509 RepID=A0A3N4HWP8_ASCIM|nr:hypothetical protein BJ508DRAFT_417041 [Ascobolus immersus RN42]